MCEFVEVNFFKNQSFFQKEEYEPFEPQESQTTNYDSCQFSSLEAEESATVSIFIEGPNLTDSMRPRIKNQARSVLHNMQKHFFTFVQFLTPKKGSIIESDQGYQPDVIKCVKELLKLVKNQKRKTKEELVPIFGQFDQKRMNRPNLSYGNFFQNYEHRDLRTSLSLLKEFYLSKIKSLSIIEEYVQNSKMEKKQEFKKYVESFIEEVETNKFKFRLSKESQQKIKLSMNQKKKDTEWENYFDLN